MIDVLLTFSVIAGAECSNGVVEVEFRTYSPVTRQLRQVVHVSGPTEALDRFCAQWLAKRGQQRVKVELQGDEIPANVVPLA